MQKYYLIQVVPMEPASEPSNYWLNLLERDGWILVSVEGRKLGVVISITEAGREHLKVAGYHLGDSRYVGERQNILSIRVERIPESRREALLAAIRNALPIELRELSISFL